MSQSLARGLASTRAVRGRGRGRPYHAGSSNNKSSKPPLTHFIALPIGHHASLRERISSFTSALQNTEPPIPGLDDSIIILPRRLHLTLGVMSLTSDPATGQSSQSTTSGTAGSESQTNTLSAALSLLTALKPRIMAILTGHKLSVALNRMDIMNPDRGDLDKAHVLWVGPLLEGDDARRLREVCELVNRAFIDAGLVVDDRRPLKLHCTIINTTYRKPRSKAQRRQPFSYSSILRSTACRAISTDAIFQKNETHRPVSVDFGAWEVDQLQICRMGSHGVEGEYISCGGCSLVDGA